MNYATKLMSKSYNLLTRLRHEGSNYLRGWRKMNNAQLNQLGIFLDFLSGFLMAPEIIGEARIERVESGLKRLLDQFVEIEKIGTRMRRFAKISWGWIRSPNRFELFLYVDLVIVATVFLFALSNDAITFSGTNCAILLVILFLVVLGIRFENKGLYLSFYLILPLAVVLFPVILLPRLLSWFITFIIWPLRALVWVLWFIASRVRGFLQHNHRLRAVIVSLGVIFFTVGNFLQFIATT